MKTKLMNRKWRTCAAALILLSPLPVFAGDQTQNKPATKSEQKKDSGTLKLSRADDILGRDVMSSDGEKVGDIVDFVLHLDGTTRLSHVLVMSGGFLDMGGDVRPVPIEAIQLKEGSPHITMAADKFYRAPLVTEDRHKFFTDRKLVGSVNEHFGVKHATGKQAKTEAQKQQAQNQKPAPQKSGGEAEVVVFSNLNRNEVRGSNGGDLGVVTDAWVSLAEGRVPLIEIRPGPAVGMPFGSTPLDLRYEIPAARLQRVEDGEAHFNVTSNDLENAESADSVEWVDRDFRANDPVLRIDLSQAKRQQEQS